MLVCGIDIGTTNLKVALYDAAMTCVWLRAVPTPRSDDGQGPVTDADALARIIADLIVGGWHAAGRGRRIAAIATAGVGEDGVTVDARLHPLGPALPWFDTRAAAEAAELAPDPRAGIGIDPARSAAKWLWLARNRPEQDGPWLALTDFPLALWAGSPFIAESLAARTACYDAAARHWIAPLLAAARAPVLPPVLRAGQVAGRMRDPHLIASGAVDADTLLVAGGHDHPVAAHAVHRLAADARVDSLGTANVIYGEMAPQVPEALDPLIAFGPSIDAADRMACLGVFEFSAAVARFPGGTAAIRGVLDLPRIPGAPMSAPGTERQLLEWATLNARAMLARMAALGVAPGPIFATGGWSRSRALLELRASIFGQPVHAPAEAELTVLGAGLLAMSALGRAAAPRIPVTVIDPDPAWMAAYADLS